MSDRTAITRPLARRRVSALLWIVGFGLCASPVFLGILNHDVSWFLSIAGRVLSGQRLYVDVLEVNPPLIVWMTCVPVMLAHLLGLSEILTFRILMLGVVAGSLFVSKIVLRRIQTVRPASQDWFLALAMVAFLPLVGYDFGQREHLMVVLFVPYLLLASGRAEAREAGAWLPWLVGCMAAAGILLKPHFILVWVAVECYLLVVRRDWRVWLRPEALAVAAIGLGYGIGVMVFLPEYLSFLRWITPVYAAYGRAPAKMMLTMPATTLTLVAFLGLLVRKPDGELRTCCHLLLIATLTLLSIAFLQDKGLGYHFYPPLATATLLLGVLACSTPASETLIQRGATQVARCVLAVLILGASSACLGEARLWRGHPDETDTTVGRMARLVKKGPNSGSIYTFSLSVAPSFPLVTYGRLGWASRYSCLLFLPVFYPDGLPAVPSKATEASNPMGPTERVFFDTVIRDLESERPTWLFVDETEKKPAFNDRPFDFLAYYSRDPRFTGFMQDYERTSKIDQFGVYRRKGSGLPESDDPETTAGLPSRTLSLRVGP